jgi:hypothetical protein
MAVRGAIEREEESRDTREVAQKSIPAFKIARPRVYTARGFRSRGRVG